MRSVRCLIALSLLPLVPAAATAAPPKPAAVADKIVTDVAGIKENEVVFIEGETDDRALLDELWLAAGRRGALPLLRLNVPANLREWFASVDKQYDGNLAALEDKLSALPDVVIVVDRTNDPALFADVDPGRMAAFGQSFAPLSAKRMARKTRIVYLGNGLFPTPATAKTLGVSQAQLSDIFWAGIATDYKKLAALGEAVKVAVPAGHPVTIKTPAGTDLTLVLSARPMNVSDGVVSAEEAAQGGPALWTWLPAGEVYGLVEAGTAGGKIVMPRMPYEGSDVRDLVLTVKGGKVVEMTAKPSKAFAAFKARYDATSGAKDLVSILDFGLNADVRAPQGKRLLSFVPAGTVTVFVGGDTWAGGTNDVAWGAALYQPDATVTVDGKLVVDKGVLIVGAAK